MLAREQASRCRESHVQLDYIGSIVMNRGSPAVKGLMFVDACEWRIVITRSTTPKDNFKRS